MHLYERARESWINSDECRENGDGSCDDELFMSVKEMENADHKTFFILKDFVILSNFKPNNVFYSILNSNTLKSIQNF